MQSEQEAIALNTVIVQSLKVHLHCSLRANVPCRLAKLPRSCHLFTSRSDNPPRLLPDLPGVFLPSQTQVKSWENLKEWVLSFQPVGPRDRSGLLGLEASTLAH